MADSDKSVLDRVLVDDVSDDADSFRPGPVWLLGAAVAVVAILVVLPGSVPVSTPESTLIPPDMALTDPGWEVLELPGSGSLNAATVLDDGTYVVAGDGPQFWWSAGGDRWVWAKTAGGTSSYRVTDVAGFEAGAVAVGADEGNGSVPVAAAWWSTDGTGWQERDVAVAGPATLTGVEASDGIMVAWGWTGSGRAFDPAARALMMTSTDGETWTQVDPPDEDARLHEIGRHGGTWYVAGASTGQAALWRSDDLVEWERIPTDGLPFGWAMDDAAPGPGGLEANLVDLSSGRTQPWSRQQGIWNPDSDAIPAGPADLAPFDSGAVGVGSGRLWQREAALWETVEIDGKAEAAVDGLAVGSGDGQPRLWRFGSEGTLTHEVPDPVGTGWEMLADLGEGQSSGAWPVADGWLVATTDDWWLIDASGHQRVPGLPDPDPEASWKVASVGEEWVLLPHMYWSADGHVWEPRAEPWPVDPGGAMGVAARPDRVVAVGTDRARLWRVSESLDAGRSWSDVADSRPTTPVWDIASVADGFVASAARDRGRREIVRSADGVTWETMAPGALVASVNVPAALTESGSMLLLDRDEELDPPHVAPTALARSGDEVLLVGGNRMWVGSDEWRSIPLDPGHGMTGGDVRPVPVGDRLMAVAVDRGRVSLYEWEA